MSTMDRTKELLVNLVTDLEAEADIERRMREGQSFLVGADGTFLGRIVSPEHPESLLNPTGPHGGTYGARSVFNVVGEYGREDGEYSARNPKSLTPPLLYIRGEFWGVVSTNTQLEGRVVSPERFLEMLSSDWHAVERGGLSDSGSIRIQAAK